MQEWPPEKLARVATFVERLRLPASGAFLDFGCGTGVFTALLQAALPGWRACGSDIVDVALERPSSDAPAPNSAVWSGSGTSSSISSFHIMCSSTFRIWTRRWRILPDSRRAGGAMIVIMPCGNAGSLEHDICSARADGIDAAYGNRFFFEDEGHLRRLYLRRCSKQPRRLTASRYCSQSFANHTMER